MEEKAVKEMIQHTEQKARCSMSGEKGLVTEIPGSDDWKVHCPACGSWWHGGSEVLEDHDRP